MSRTIAEHDALIERLERSAVASPAAYRARVVALALLGFAYVGALILAGLLAVTLVVVLFVAHPGVASAKIAFVAGVPAFYLLLGSVRALWVHYPPPEGTEITADEFPELFQRIEAIRERLDGPRIHHVLLVGDLNAAIVGIPRLGLLGWHKNYLVLGLDLMASMTPEEFDSVVGHELGHLAGNHGKTSAWIYRLRITWHRLATYVEQTTNMTFLYRRFFDWFVPYFGAYSFVLARRHEYEADASAAAVTSPRVAGAALCRINGVAGYYGEVFWPGVQEKLKRLEPPPAGIYHELERVAAELDGSRTANFVRKALEAGPDYDDVHPSLAQRLDALGVEAEELRPVERNAAEAYLGDAYRDVLDAFSAQWLAQTEQAWTEAQESLSGYRQRLEELVALRAERGALELGDWQEFAALLAVTAEKEDAIRECRSILDEHPDDVNTALQLGEMLLDDAELEGLGLVERAAADDSEPHRACHACEVLIGYHLAHGIRTDAQPWIDRYERIQQDLHAALVERSLITRNDTFHPPALTPEARARLEAALAPWQGRVRIDVAQKDVEHFPEEPLYVFAVEKKTGPITRSAEQEIGELVEVELEFASRWVDMSESELRKLGKKIRKNGIRVV